MQKHASNDRESKAIYLGTLALRPKDQSNPAAAKNLCSHNRPDPLLALTALLGAMWASDRPTANRSRSERATSNRRTRSPSYQLPPHGLGSGNGAESSAAGSAVSSFSS